MEPQPDATARKSNRALAAIRRRLDAGDGGAAARESFKRHCEHLEALAANLRKIGMDEREVDENIMMVFREYETELMSYIDSL